MPSDRARSTPSAVTCVAPGEVARVVPVARQVVHRAQLGGVVAGLPGAGQRAAQQLGGAVLVVHHEHRERGQGVGLGVGRPDLRAPARRPGSRSPPPRRRGRRSGRRARRWPAPTRGPGVGGVGQVGERPRRLLQRVVHVSTPSRYRARPVRRLACARGRRTRSPRRRRARAGRRGRPARPGSRRPRRRTRTSMWSLLERRGDLRDRLPQPQDDLQVPQLLRGREHLVRLVGRVERRPQRRRQVRGAQGVRGQLRRRPERRVVAEHPQVGAVQRRLLPGQQVRVHGLGQQGVPERDAARPRRPGRGARRPRAAPRRPRPGRSAAGPRRRRPRRAGAARTPGGPAADAMRARRWTDGSSSSRRARRTSASDHGSSSASAPASRSSSAKYALPSDRSMTRRSVRLRQRGAAQRGGELAQLVVGERRQVEPLDPGVPASSVATGRHGCRRCRSSVR